jgi:hypothetical protein
MGTVNEPLEPRLGAAKAESFSRTRQRSALWPSCRSTFRHLARGRQVAKLTRRVVGLEPARRVPVASCAFGGLYLAGDPHPLHCELPSAARRLATQVHLPKRAVPAS